MKILILTGLTYYDRAYSLAGIIKAQAKMLIRYGHEVGIVVAKGMANKEHLDGFTVYEAIDRENTLVNLREIIKNYEVVFTHDFVWVVYMEWLNKVVAKLEDEFPVNFYHFIHSAPGNTPCLDWQKGRVKRNVFYCYPNDSDKQRLAEYIGVPFHKVLTVRFSNDFIDKMGGNEELYEKLGLMEAEYVGFYPAHLMPGKQAPEILMCVKRMVERGLSVKFVFTANSMESGDALARLNSYREMAKKMGIEKNIVWLPDYPEFVGETPYEVVQQLWKITNLFITPSVSETTSLMLLEAMAHRCLIVANDSLRLNHEIVKYGAIFHPFGSHFDNRSAMDDASLDKMVDIIKQWMKNSNPLYCWDRIKRTYSRKAIYENYYKPFLVADKVISRISVIIPILNRKQETIDLSNRAIASVRQCSNTEVIIINNEPKDTTIYDADVVINNLENVGVSKAWNQGLQKATGEYIMILNSDVELPFGWEEKMVKCEGIVFPSVNQDQGPIVNFTFPEVQGCCFMAKKEIFDKIGFFDERFFAYYEDIDYWKRAKSMGIKPSRADLIIKHTMNSSSGSLPNLGQIIEESKKKFEKKWKCVIL